MFAYRRLLRDEPTRRQDHSEIEGLVVVWLDLSYLYRAAEDLLPCGYAAARPAERTALAMDPTRV